MIPIYLFISNFIYYCSHDSYKINKNQYNKN